MDDLISRQAAIDEAEEWIGAVYCDREEQRERSAIKKVIQGIKCLPSAQPKRGKWIHHPEIGYGETWLCDQCGEKTTSTVMGKPRANFCPNCGAKMEVTE